jgi:glycosyltransferase involved in cell wall biosynthesis
MDASDIDVTIVVPAFREARRLPRSLAEIARHFSAQPFGSELIVVDDGSDDATAEVARQLAGGLAIPATVIRYRVNRGKGHALKVGFAHAAGRYIVFTDVDLSAPIEEADRLLAELRAGCDVAIGSRKLAKSRIEVRQSPLREWMGRWFTRLVRASLVDVSDVTCGLKGFRAEVGRDLFGRLRIPGWSFDAELLFLATRQGYTIRELPIRWSNSNETRVSMASAALGSLLDLIRISWYALRGRYATQLPADTQLEVWRSPGSPEPRERVPA